MVSGPLGTRPALATRNHPSGAGPSLPFITALLDQPFSTPPPHRLVAHTDRTGHPDPSSLHLRLTQRRPCSPLPPAAGTRPSTGSTTIASCNTIRRAPRTIWQGTLDRASATQNVLTPFRNNDASRPRASAPSTLLGQHQRPAHLLSAPGQAARHPPMYAPFASP